MPVTKVTEKEIALSKTVDANGWTVYDFGSFKQYRKRVTFSTGTTNVNTIISLATSSTNLPVGVANLTGYHFQWNPGGMGWAYALHINSEVSSGSTTAGGFTAWTLEGSRAYSGYIDLTITPF